MRLSRFSTEQKKKIRERKILMKTINRNGKYFPNYTLNEPLQR